MSIPTVLVTGCAGYIGSVLVGELLNAGMKVIGVDNFMYYNASAILPYLGHPNFEFNRLSVENRQEMLPLIWRAEVLVPLAALVGAPLCKANPEQAIAVNHKAVQEMVRAASPKQRIIYPNTNSGYGATAGDHHCTELDPMKPISVYGLTKCEAEKAVLDHPGGTVFRLATVFGASPRMRLDLMVNDFTAKLLDVKEQRRIMRGSECPKDKFSIFEPHFKRNFVHVRDVARAFRFAICRGTLRGAYNLGLPDANLTKWELATTICDTIGLHRNAIEVGIGRDPDQRNYLVSNDKILNTGFTFVHDLKKGIQEVETVYKLFYRTQCEGMRNV